MPRRNTAPSANALANERTDIAIEAVKEFRKHDVDLRQEDSLVKKAVARHRKIMVDQIEMIRYQRRRHLTFALLETAVNKKLKILIDVITILDERFHQKLDEKDYIEAEILGADIEGVAITIGSVYWAKIRMMRR